MMPRPLATLRRAWNGPADLSTVAAADGQLLRGKPGPWVWVGRGTCVLLAVALVGLPLPLLLSLVATRWAIVDPAWWLAVRAVFPLAVLGTTTLLAYRLGHFIMVHAWWSQAGGTCNRCGHGLEGLPVEQVGGDPTVRCPECGTLMTVQAEDVDPASPRIAGDHGHNRLVITLAQQRRLAAMWPAARRRLLGRTVLSGSAVVVLVLALPIAVFGVRLGFAVIDARQARADLARFNATLRPLDASVSGVVAQLQRARAEARAGGADQYADVWQMMPDRLGLWLPGGVIARSPTTVDWGRPLRVLLARPLLAEALAALEHGAPPAPERQPPPLRSLREHAANPFVADDPAALWLEHGISLGLVEALIRAEAGRWREAAEMLVATDRFGRAFALSLPMCMVSQNLRLNDAVVELVARLLLERPPAEFIDAIDASGLLTTPWVDRDLHNAADAASSLFHEAWLFSDPLNHALMPWYDPGELADKRPETVPEFIAACLSLPRGRYAQRVEPYRSLAERLLRAEAVGRPQPFDHHVLVTSSNPAQAGISDRWTGLARSAVGTQLALAALRCERWMGRPPANAAELAANGCWQAAPASAALWQSVTITVRKVVGGGRSVRWHEIVTAPLHEPDGMSDEHLVFPHSRMSWELAALLRDPQWHVWWPVFPPGR